MLEGDPDIWLTPALSYQLHLARPEILAQVSQFCEENDASSSFLPSSVPLLTCNSWGKHSGTFIVIS